MTGGATAWQLPGSVVHLVLSMSTARNAAKCFSVSKIWRDVGNHKSLVQKINIEKPMEIARELGWQGLQELGDSKDGLVFRDSEFKRTLLHWAATNNHVSLAEASISAGIDLETRDFFGCTPLMLAAYYGSCETLKLLCEMGGNVDAADDYGRTSLCFAAWMGCENTTRELLAQGSNVNKIDEDGWSPLMYAAYGCHHSVTNILLAAGANVGQRSCANWLDVCLGSSAIEVAESMGDFELAKKISSPAVGVQPQQKPPRDCLGIACCTLQNYFPNLTAYLFDVVNSCFPSISGSLVIH